MRQRTILIVDDNPENLTLLGELLRGSYRVRAANSGARALQLLAGGPPPDLILLDVMMPGLSGYDVLQRLREQPAFRQIPVIFTTAMDATEDEQHGLALGAVDYITKPLRPAIVLARVKTHLALKQARDQLSHENHLLEAEVTRRGHEADAIQDVAMRALASLAETRDNETGNHIQRTRNYVAELGRRAASHPRFAAELDPHTIALITQSAPLHDIGKVGIPDHVLLKCGPLTADEWRIMRTHSALGADAIARAVAEARQPVQFLHHAEQIARHHHEHWDGSGYPDGLAGEAIPLSARLMAIADVFDALISRRVYKQALPFNRVREILEHERGRHFDPDLLDLFLGGYEVFCAIAQGLPDQREGGMEGAAPSPPGSTPP